MQSAIPERDAPDGRGPAAWSWEVNDNDIARGIPTCTWQLRFQRRCKCRPALRLHPRVPKPDRGGPPDDIAGGGGRLSRPSPGAPPPNPPLPERRGNGRRATEESP